MDDFQPGVSYKDGGDVLVQTLNSSERMELPSSSAMDNGFEGGSMLTSSRRRHNHRHHHSHRLHKGKKKPTTTKTERFNKTAAVLQKAGLMEMALQTAQIMEENAQLQRDIDALKEEAQQYAKTLEKKLQSLS